MWRAYLTATMKVKPRSISKNARIKFIDTLYTSVASLNNRDEVANFLRDVLTESERIMIGRRILIAKMLLEGKIYDEIMRELKVGKDTIMRVHRWLSDESDGYEKAITGLEKAMRRRFKNRGAGRDSDDVEEGGAMFGSFKWLRKKYPLHFLLFNMILDKNK